MANISNTLTPNSDINMSIDLVDNLFDIGNSFKDRKGHSLLLSIHKPRSPSISSNKCSEEYHICVKRDSDRMDKNEPSGFIGNIEVEYASQGE